MTGWWEFLLGDPGATVGPGAPTGPDAPTGPGEPGGSVVAGLPGAGDALAVVSDLDGDGVADHATVVDARGHPFVFVAGPADGDPHDVGNLTSDEAGPPHTPESGTTSVDDPAGNRRWFWVSGP